MSEHEHTPTPKWTYHRDSIGGFDLRIDGVFALDLGEDEERAKTMCRCVNAHAALVEACEAAKDDTSTEEPAIYLAKVAKKLRAALALAKKE